MPQKKQQPVNVSPDIMLTAITMAGPPGDDETAWGCRVSHLASIIAAQLTSPPVKSYVGELVDVRVDGGGTCWVTFDFTDTNLVLSRLSGANADEQAVDMYKTYIGHRVRAWFADSSLADLYSMQDLGRIASPALELAVQ